MGMCVMPNFDVRGVTLAAATPAMAWGRHRAQLSPKVGGGGNTSSTSSLSKSIRAISKPADAFARSPGLTA